MATVPREAMSDEQFTHLLHFFQVFSNESRLRLIGYLANGERSVGELARLLDLKEPTVSHHLAELKGLGLVSVRAEGNMRFYRLETQALQSISKDIFAQSNLAALAPKSELSDDERILRNWVKNGRLLEIPAQEKKKQIVIRWLAEQLDAQKRWPEREFNQLLVQYNEDFATLRRYLVESGYVARENGIYWRTAKRD
jgi:hypothetical protein